MYGMVGLNLGVNYGQTATINGALSISNSQNVFLYGLHVTNSPIDGITVSDSTAVLLEACTASGNTLNGLRVQNMSDVQIIGVGGAFNNNASSGIWANVGSLVWFNNWAGPIDVSNNTLDGIECEQSTCGVLGNTTFTNNGISGVDLIAGSKMEFAAYYGPNLIQGNKSGEVTARERSRISILRRKPLFVPMGRSVLPPASAARLLVRRGDYRSHQCGSRPLWQQPGLALRRKSDSE